jgi:HD-like signal output (HDOD) protein
LRRNDTVAWVDRSMDIWLLSPMVLAAAALLIRPALRRAFGSGVAVPRHSPAPSGESSAPAITGSLTVESATDEAVALTPIRRLEPPEIFALLRQLELSMSVPELPAREPDPQVAAALAVIGEAARERRHFPRRPNLLPQLMHTINDESTARRQLVAIIARDPALVDSLLRMANSSFYRLSAQPVESIERAVAILGSDGLRSVIATALLQPIFDAAAAQDFPRFAPLVWEHALRSAQAAVVHAAVAERTEPFAAELLSLISGMAEIVLFRAARAQCAAAAQGAPSAAALIGALLRAHAGVLAQRIAADWQLSEAARAALGEQCGPGPASTPLGRSLRFGRLAGALAVLHVNSAIDAAVVRSSLAESSLPAAHAKILVGKLLQPLHDPRTGTAPLKQN